MMGSILTTRAADQGEAPCRTPPSPAAGSSRTPPSAPPPSDNGREARRSPEAATKAGVATQMGTQIHASGNYRRVVELVQAGAVGPVGEVHVWVSRAWGRQSAEDAKRNKDIVAVAERP